MYSTEGGRIPSERPPQRQAPKPSPPGAPDDGVVRIWRDRGGRGGKIVTVIRGLPERGAALEARVGELRRACGAGGTVKDGAVLIQGDHRERVAQHLRSLGYTVKLAGG